MAKLEIPSIVVQSGNHTPPVMDRSAARTQWSLSTQSTYDDETDPVVSSPNDGEVDHPLPPCGNKESETKTEEKNAINNNLPRPRSKANLKLLKRSHAIKESTSPPPDVPLSPTNELPNLPSSNNNNSSAMNNNGSNPRPITKREGSNQSSDSNLSSSLSRGNSTEQQPNEQPPINIEQFLADTINGNAKDRIFLLRIENELINFIKDTRQDVLDLLKCWTGAVPDYYVIRKNTHKFGMMTSYQRMLVHRVAHYYGVEHNVDASGHMVVVSKGKSTKMPTNRLNYFIRGDLLLSEEPRKSILKRDSASFEDTVSFKSPDRHTADAPRRSKSFEEREEEYEKVRARIFHQEHGEDNQDGCSHDCDDELRWSQLSGTWERPESSDSTKLHPNSHRPSRLTKVESYESRDTLRANSLRSSVSKSYSFGGYDQSSNNRVLTKQDSGSSAGSRVSPSSSGYKSQSQRSDTTMSATPSPTATPHFATQLSNQSGAFSPDIEQETVLWAVTNMASVPVGSVLINPQTGQPVKNEDGSLYHYDPENPPKINSGTTESATSVRQTCENERKSECRNTSSGRRTQNELNETPMTPPVLPSTSTYHHVEGSTHTESESSANSMAPVQIAPYHHIPPPVPTAPVQHMPAGASNYAAAMMYNPPSASYNVMMQHPTIDGYAAPPTNAQPIIYGLPPTPGSQQFAPAPVTGAAAPYDRGLNTMEGQDICGYLMGMSLGERTEAQPRQTVYYCHQPSHFAQATGPAATAPAVPLYFTHANPAPPAQTATHQPRYAQCTYQYSQPSDRPAPECNYSQPSIHTYFSRCPTTPQVGSTSFCTTTGGSTGASVPMGALVLPPAHTQTSRPFHRMPTPPNTPQNGCVQYPMYNNGYTSMPGCYQHFQASNPQTQIPLPPMMRPGLQLNVGNSPPLRAMRAPTYNAATSRSPVMRDGAPSEPQRPTSSPLRYPAPVAPSAPAPHYFYRFPFLTNDMILMNNNRAPFASPPVASRLQPSVSVPFPNIRRHRPRPVGNTPRSIVIAQQQATLTAAIEGAGNNDPNGVEERYGRRWLISKFTSVEETRHGRQ